MAEVYLVTPKASNAIVKVALAAATLKTVLQIATPANEDIQAIGWGVSFDAAAAGGEVQCELMDTDVAATVTAMTPEKTGGPNDVASLCVGGTTATGYNATGEGTVAASMLRDAQLVNVQSGYAVWWPREAWPKIAASRFLRVRCNSPSVVNVIPWIAFLE